jgi:uncharacterized protein YcbX
VRVLALSATPVKGLRVAEREQLELEPDGIRGDRRFYLIDAHGRMVNGKRHGALNEVTAELDAEQELTLGFPDGSRLTGRAELGEELDSTFFSRPRRARTVEGPFSKALSRHVGEELRLVAAADGSSAIDRGQDGSVSLISRGSLAALAIAAETSAIDARRFRMSIEIDAQEPFLEESWVNREIAVGEARIALRGHVGRCIVTSRDPESGKVDLPTLDLLRELRKGATSTEPLPFGVYGAVVQPGVVRVGDAVELSG